MVKGETSGSDIWTYLPVTFQRGTTTPTSHHRDEETQRGEYEKIGTWHVEQIGHMLERMASLEEQGKPLLDHCQLMFGTTLSDGNRHDSHHLPLVLAGRAKGEVKPGRVLESKCDTPMCYLLLAMARNAGSEIEEFGDSTGPI